MEKYLKNLHKQAPSDSTKTNFKKPQNRKGIENMKAIKSTTETKSECTNCGWDMDTWKCTTPNRTSVDFHISHDVKNKRGIWESRVWDIYTIPKSGAELWCTAWNERKAITPYGDCLNVRINDVVCTCGTLAHILSGLEEAGHQWGIDGATLTRIEEPNDMPW